MNRREALGAMLSVPLVGVVPRGFKIIHNPTKETLGLPSRPGRWGYLVEFGELGTPRHKFVRIRSTYEPA